MPAIYFVALILFAIGFVPMQALSTRRISLILGAIGLAALPATVFVYNLTAPKDMGAIAYVVWASLVWFVAYGVLCGAITRLGILSRPPMETPERWGIVAVAYVVFAVAGWFGVNLLSQTL